MGHPSTTNPKKKSKPAIAGKPTFGRLCLRRSKVVVAGGPKEALVTSLAETDGNFHIHGRMRMDMEQMPHQIQADRWVLEDYGSEAEFLHLCDFFCFFLQGAVFRSGLGKFESGGWWPTVNHATRVASH